MSISVTFNGVAYIIPETDEIGWGANLDDYFVAIAAGALQKSGGSFTLSADVDFGASFGLKSSAYKGRTANPAAAGVVRLAKSESVSWRNNANSGDLVLGVNASDELTYNGAVLSTTAIVIDPGLQYQLGYYAADGQDISPLALITGSRALASDVNGLPVASAVTATELGYVSGVTSAIQTQLDAKEPTITVLPIVQGGTNSGTALLNNRVMTSVAGSIVEAAAITANRALISDANGLPTYSVTTATELTYLSGVTSAIQTQLNLLAPKASPTFSGTITTPLTASRALVTGASSELAVSAVTATELGYVSGVTSAIQTQLNLLAPLASPTFTGVVSIPLGLVGTPSLIFAGDTNTGIYSPAADRIGLVANGIESVRIYPSAAGFLSGTATDPGIAFQSETNSGLYRAGSHDIRVTVNGADVAILTNVSWALKAGGNTMLEYDSANAEIGIHAPFTPNADNSYAIGRSGRRFTAIWAANGTIQTSISDTKTNLQPIDETSEFVCKVPQPALFTRPGEDSSKVRLGWLADSLPETAHPMLEDGTRDGESVYTDSILAMHSLALRRDYQRMKDQDAKIAALEARLAALESK